MVQGIRVGLLQELIFWCLVFLKMDVSNVDLEGGVEEFLVLNDMEVVFDDVIFELY